MRKFEKLSDVNKYKMLLKAYMSALSEPDEMKKGWKTDIYGIARQYYGKYLLKSDFDLIKNKTIDEINNIIKTWK